MNNYKTAEICKASLLNLGISWSKCLPIHGAPSESV
jgi:hypothetical protein